MFASPLSLVSELIKLVSTQLAGISTVARGQKLIFAFIPVIALIAVIKFISLTVLESLIFIILNETNGYLLSKLETFVLADVSLIGMQVIRHKMQR